MTPQLLVPNPKNTRLLYCKSRVKILFPVYSGRFIPAHAQMGLSGLLENIIGNNNRWFKICDKGDDTPAPSPEPKKCATFILQVKS
nr:unnamed protein product [Callosobruchus analis]